MCECLKGFGDILYAFKMSSVWLGGLAEVLGAESEAMLSSQLKIRGLESLNRIMFTIRMHLSHHHEHQGERIKRKSKTTEKARYSQNKMFAQIS